MAGDFCCSDYHSHPNDNALQNEKPSDKSKGSSETDRIRLTHLTEKGG